MKRVMQKNHTSSSGPILRALITALFALTALLALGLGWRAGPGLTRLDVEKNLPEERSALFYAHQFSEAMEARRFDHALEASRTETDNAPLSHGAWQRRALAATAVNGQPDREALASLLKAYDLAPYPAPADMAWRVEFAARYETSMPDQLTALALTQVQALAGIPESYARRFEWCKTFPDGALVEAVCATVPGTWRNGVRQ